MIYQVRTSKSFRKQYERIANRKKLSVELDSIIYKLAHAIPLERRYCVHSLKGRYQGSLELHIKPDLLLIYRYEEVTIFLENIGSHSELFG